MRLSAAVLAGLFLTSCVTIGGADDAPVELAPSFAPADSPPPAAPSQDESPASDAPATDGPAPTASTSTPPTAPRPGATESSPAPATPPPADAAPTTPPPEPAPPRTATSTVTDAPDDRTRRLTGSPDWADLAAADLTRTDDEVTLTVTFGTSAPATAPDADHTMNVASYYDLDGDGRIDVEVWANLADEGWDTAQYDNRGEGSAAFSGEDDIDVAVDDGRLVLHFPATVLDGAWSFRWAMASEYGRYEELGTRLMARDDMPDDDRPVIFPNG